PARRPRVEQRERAIGARLLHLGRPPGRPLERRLDLRERIERRRPALARLDAEGGPEPEVAGGAVGGPPPAPLRRLDRERRRLLPPLPRRLVIGEPNAGASRADQPFDAADVGPRRLEPRLRGTVNAGKRALSVQDVAAGQKIVDGGVGSL